MRVTYNPYLRKKFKKDLHGTVYIRVTCERKHLYVNTFLYLEEKYWDKKKLTVRVNEPDAAQLNDLIALEISKVRRTIIDFRLKGGVIGFESIKQLFIVNNIQTPIVDIKDYYNTESNVSSNRKKLMTTAVKHALANNVPDVLQNIKSSHLIALKNQLSKNLKKNTVLSIMKRLKTLLKFAVAKEIINKNPMDGIILGEFESKKDFLTEYDLKKIEAIVPDLNADYAKIAKMFLFSCYTGLRFSDAMNLEKMEIKKNDSGLGLYFSQRKTKELNYIPLLPEAVKLLLEVKGLKYTNQYYNRTLKSIGEVAGIKTSITSHLARHTFATIGLNKGIKMEVMQSLLGHSNIKITQGYAKLLDSTKREELNKWSK